LSGDVRRRTAALSDAGASMSPFGGNPVVVVVVVVVVIVVVVVVVVMALLVLMYRRLTFVVVFAATPHLLANQLCIGTQRRRLQHTKHNQNYTKQQQQQHTF
jgi:uncharacterized protein (DUF2062 family)